MAIFFTGLLQFGTPAYGSGARRATDVGSDCAGPLAERALYTRCVSATETKTLIAEAIGRVEAEVPALRQLKLVIKLELPGRGADAPIWRVEVPGPNVDRDPAADARLNVVIQRQQFNELAREGGLRQWAKAYEQGHVKVSGDSSVVKLLGNVIERQLIRAK
jgi:hypothetical protein